MYKTKAPDGKLNLCGAKVAKYRLALVPACSQRALADKLQLLGLVLPRIRSSASKAGTAL